MLLLVIIVAALAGGGSDDGSAGAGDGVYSASFSEICGKSASEMDLAMAGDYPFSRGALPSGVQLNGDAWLDDDYGVRLGEHDRL